VSDRPLVSIVIPCYNQARYLGEAIDSARQQTWPATQVVVVDDGSTDGSADVAAPRTDVRLLRQRNQGVASARNAGLAASTGRFIIFLDADDRLHAEAAEIAVRVFGSHPLAMLVFGRAAAIDAVGCSRRSMTVPVEGDMYAAFLTRNPIWTPGMAAWRREGLEALGGFDPREGPSADYDLYLRAAWRFPVVAHDAVVADYRQHGASMSARPDLMLASTLAVLRGQWRIAARRPEWRRAWRKGRRGWRVFYGEQMVDRVREAMRRPKGRADAMRWAFRLLRAWPQGAARHLSKKARLGWRR
jgi:glycosyltransferase involved in cell wall biosynthesis